MIDDDKVTMLRQTVIVARVIGFSLTFYLELEFRKKQLRQQTGSLNNSLALSIRALISWSARK